MMTQRTILSSAFQGAPSAVLGASLLVVSGLLLACGQTRQTDDPVSQQGPDGGSAGAGVETPDQQPPQEVATASTPRESYSPEVLAIEGVDLSKLTFEVPRTAGQISNVAGPQLPGTPNQPAAPTGPPGRLSWVEGEGLHEFGEIVEGETRDHVFRMQSDGENDLVITDIKPSCGCTRSVVYVLDGSEERTEYALGTPLAPGTQFELETTLDTQRRSGPFRSNISLFCNDPRQVVALQLSAEVKPVLTVEPNHLNFGPMKGSETKTMEFAVTTSQEEPYSLKVVDTILPDEIQVEPIAKAPDADGRALEWSVRVTLGPDIPEGNKNYAVRLLSDLELPAPAAHDEAAHDETAPDHNPHAPPPDAAQAPPRFREVGLFAIAQVKGVFTAQPIWLSFGQMRPGEVVTRALRVTCEDAGFSFSEPEVTIRGYPGPNNPDGEFEYPDIFDVSVIAVPDEAAYDVEVTIQGFGDEMNGSFRGLVRIGLNHPEKDALEVPFNGVCRPGVGR